MSNGNLVSLVEKMESKAASLPGFNQYSPYMSSAQALDTVLSDPSTNTIQKATVVNIIGNAEQQTGLPVITTQGLVDGAIAAGVGYAQGAILGKGLGAIFGLSPQAQKTVGRFGILGGLLSYTGIWQ